AVMHASRLVGKPRAHVVGLADDLANVAQDLGLQLGQLSAGWRHDLGPAGRLFDGRLGPRLALGLEVADVQMRGRDTTGDLRALADGTTDQPPRGLVLVA